MQGFTSSFKKFFCRIAQRFIKAGNYFIGYRMPEYLEGPGSIESVGTFLSGKGIQDVLVVTGASLLRKGLTVPMLCSMEEHRIAYTLFTPSGADPSSSDVEAGFHIFRNHNCRAIVALGGGSRIDCAKAIAAKAARPNKSVAQLQGLLKVRRKTVPLIAIPTTAGAGSETTIAAVITDSATGRKRSINDPCLIPRYAILDPIVTVGLPPFTTAITGMDALTHAVEAYINHIYNTPLEENLARDAVCLIHDNLLIAFQDGTNLIARQNMQKAAFFAGRAFTRGCVGYVHAIGHTLGGLYGVPHGLAMSVLLLPVLQQYGTPIQKRLAELADVCSIPGQTSREKSDSFLTWIDQLQRTMGIPKKLDVVRDADIGKMIAWAKKEAHPLYPVPVIWEDVQFREVISQIRF